jgi:hypothetical protein
MTTKEGISLNQYIINTLTRQVSANYIVKSVSESEIKQQQQDFQLLLADLGEANESEINSFLNDRERVTPEAVLTEDILSKFQDLING